MFKRGQGRRVALRIAIALVCLGSVALGRYWIVQRSTLRWQKRPVAARNSGEKLRRASPADAVASEEVPAEIRAFCGDCHATPRPDRAPREAWEDEVHKGYERYQESDRHDLAAPPAAQVVAYFRRHARPAAELCPPPCASVDQDGLRFERTDIVTAGGTREPFLAGITASGTTEGAPPGLARLIFTDMRNGQVAATGPRWTSLPTEIGRLASPCHVEPCDLDQDGRTDLVIADLGSFGGSDHRRGKVIWLRSWDDGQYQPIELATGLGRVADARPGDFDGDGDLDLVVAEFGWHQTGRVLLLENRALGEDSADFDLHVADSRHGAIHVPVTDLNHDGHLDFVALISQEHEVIEAFLGRGDLRFDRETIFAAEDPSYASSGIELVDLDADGDLDVLYVNGDCFDVGHMKPYHAVQWLENEGGYPFEHHLLAQMPGASRAVAGDLDGDGDLDVAAASLLPPTILSDHGAENFDSLVWFEQTSPRRFERRGLEKAACRHACLELGDFDADGDLDMAVGNATFERPPRGQEPPALTIWWNQLNPSSSADEGKKIEGKKMGAEQRATTERKRESQNAK